MRTIADATQEQLMKFAAFNAFYTEEVMYNLQNRFNEFKISGQSKPYYRAYLNIVKRTARLIKSLNIEDPLTKCSFFYYLLHSGFFSQNHTYAFVEENRISDISSLGADIMLGKAACLNTSDMLSRILRSTGTESYIIGCDVKDIIAHHNSEYTETPKWQSLIAANLDSFNLSNIYQKLATMEFLDYGNHALSLFAYHHSYYLADPTNLTFLSITDFLEATYTGEQEKAKLKPAVTLMLEEVNPQKFKDIVLRSFIFSDEPPLEVPLVKQHSSLSLNIIARNISLIEQFYEANRPDIDIVCKTLK